MVICKREDPQNAKLADLFAAFEVMAEAPLSLTDGSSSERRREKKKKALTRANVLAGRKPFCTTSGGADHHAEALPSSWHRPHRRLRLVSDSLAAAPDAPPRAERRLWDPSPAPVVAAMRPVR